MHFYCIAGLKYLLKKKKLKINKQYKFIVFVESSWNILYLYKYMCLYTLYYLIKM
jgi:hypothetical protein